MSKLIILFLLFLVGCTSQAEKNLRLYAKRDEAVFINRCRKQGGVIIGLNSDYGSVNKTCIAIDSVIPIDVGS